MTQKLPPNASVARQSEGAKMHAPAAARNVGDICDLLVSLSPADGSALEIASGTGQHVSAFSAALPGLDWQPTEISADRIASIDAYAAETDSHNLRPAVFLDATRHGWSAEHSGQALIVLVNLLHLISTPQAETLICEAIQALAPGGHLVIYGPFLRGGTLTSEGDARFDADLRAADPSIGYKNDAQVEAWMQDSAASTVVRRDMPANNLAFITTRLRDP